MAPVKSIEQSHRLDRIESKIDKLAETVVQMARVEEKLVTIETDKKVFLERLIKTENRVDTMDKKVDENAVTIKVINRLFWIVITSAIVASIGILISK